MSLFAISITTLHFSKGQSFKCLVAFFIAVMFSVKQQVRFLHEAEQNSQFLSSAFISETENVHYSSASCKQNF